MRHVKPAVLLIAAVGLTAGLLAAPASSIAATPPPPTAGLLTQLAGPAGCVEAPNVPADGCSTGKALKEAGSVAVTSDGAFVYVAGTADGGSIDILRRSPVNGELTQSACVAATAAGGCTVIEGLTDINAILLSPDDDTLYVASAASTGKVLLLSRADDGKLSRPGDPSGCVQDSPLPSDSCAPGTGIPAPNGLALDESGDTLFVTSLTGGGALGSVAAFNVSNGFPVFSSCAQSGKDVPPMSPCRELPGLINAAGIAVKGDNVYVASGGEASLGALTALDRGLTTSSCRGSQTGCSFARGAGSLTDVVVSADGKNVYASSQDLSTDGSIVGGGVLAFLRTGGQLFQLAGADGCVVQTTAAVSAGCATGRGLKGMGSLAIAQDGAQVYTGSALLNPSATNKGETGSSAVAVFNRDAGTGVLTQPTGNNGCVSSTSADGCTVVRGLRSPGSAPRSVALSPTGSNVYASAAVSNGVAAFIRHGSDLRVSVSAPNQPYAVGQESTLTVQVFNAGPLPATNTAVIDFISAGAATKSAKPSQGTCSAPPITCQLGTIAVEGTATVTVTFLPTTVGTATNTAQAYSDHGDASPSDNVVRTDLVSAGPGLSAVSGAGQSTQVNTDFGEPLRAALRDAQNKPVVGAQVTFTAPASGPSALFGNSSFETVVTDANGVATSTKPRANGTVGSYDVIVSSPRTSSISMRLTNTSAATPSATPTATASPTATPSSSCNATAQNLPVRINTPTINATGLASVTVSGSQAFSVVELQGYSQNHYGTSNFGNDTTPIDRTATADANGAATFNDLRPASNTRVRARQAGCPFSSSATGAVINVRAQETLQVSRTGPRSYVFSGRSIPARPGGLIVSLYRIVGSGCAAGVEPKSCPGEVFLAQARAATLGSSTEGLYSIRYTFPAKDQNVRDEFVVKTGQDAQNAPGRSNARSLLIY